MRKALLRYGQRWENRRSRVYTWLLRGSLKQCGSDVRFDYPVRLGHPERISFGDTCFIYPRVWMNCVGAWAGRTYSGEIHVGNNVGIGYGVQISAAGSIVIEDNVAISAGAVIVDHIHDHTHIALSVYDSPISDPQPVRIGEGSFLGVHCFVGPGVQIGEHVVVAANAVVTKNVPSYCVVAGNPGRIVRYHTPATEQPDAPATDQPAVAEAGAGRG